MAKKIFTYKDTMIDLSKVSIIDMDDDTIVTFYMDDDWEFELDIDDDDIKIVKAKLIELFNS